MIDNKNMYLWDQVSETDPKITKHINQRGGFTSICAYNQIMRATELWGPMGTEWNAIPEFKVEQGIVWTCTQLMYPTEAGPAIIKVPGACELIIEKDGKRRVDTDAFKKAFTDSITKGLSYLGFNADVFLGKFDDNKYVQSMNEKYKNDTAVMPPVNNTASAADAFI